MKVPIRNQIKFKHFFKNQKVICGQKMMNVLLEDKIAK